jgi:hypothetical protein
MSLLNLIAPKGRVLPVEGQPGQMITDAAPVQVVASHYYTRALADGDVLEVKKATTTDAVAAVAEKTDTKTAK